MKFLLSLFLLSIVSEGAFFRAQIVDLKMKATAGDLGEEILDRSWQRGSGFQSSHPISRFREFSMVVPSLVRDCLARLTSRGAPRLRFYLESEGAIRSKREPEEISVRKYAAPPKTTRIRRAKIISMKFFMEVS